MDYQRIIDKYYPAGTRLRDIYLRHCRQVADKALEIAATKRLDVDAAQVEAAAMLHDIGIFLTDAPGIDCHGSAPYLLHGAAGADLLRREDAPEWAARVAERHTGAGITQADVAPRGILLPQGRSYMPQSTLERLVCYADKFFSKSGTMEEKPLERVRKSLAKYGPDTLARFEALHREFGQGKGERSRR